MLVNLLSYSSSVRLLTEPHRMYNNDLMDYSEYISERSFSASGRVKAFASKYMHIFLLLESWTKSSLLILFFSCKEISNSAWSAVIY